MENWQKILIGIGMVAVLIFLGLKITGYAIADNPNANNLDAFAKCLTESGAKMYGTYWCGHCQNQKEMFGESFQYIDYVECDPESEVGDLAACDEAGITGYPTWSLGNGERLLGVQSLETLAEKSGCEAL